jgi:hypothetical protein
MTLLTRIRQKHITLMQKTLATLNNIFANVTPEQATTLRDGEDGWTPLEVLCHVRDFDVIFQDRVRLMLAEDNPSLTPYDHVAMAEEKDYNNQDITQVLADLNRTRIEFAELFISLTDEQWERGGIHAEAGAITLTDSLIQVGHHDNDHIEQITRILRDGR